MSEKLIQQLRSAAGHHKKYPKGSDRGLLRLAADRIAELGAKLQSAEEELAISRAKLARVKEWAGESRSADKPKLLMWSELVEILSDTRKPLAVEEGVVAVEGKTTHYAVIKAPCDLPAGTEGTVVFMPKEGDNGVD